MFHPNERPLGRGWVGRVEGGRVVHLAAQTLQAFFLGGGGAREHAEYPLAGVTLLAPVTYPPAVRIFDAPRSFAFANPAAVAGPGVEVPLPAGVSELVLLPRLAAVVGAEGRAGGFTILAELRAPVLAPPKDRDFALLLGPLVVTPDELVPAGFDWEDALAYAAANTVLRAGDLVAGPELGGERRRLEPGAPVEVEVEGIGVLRAAVAGVS
jgi:hypothetical protein